MGERVWGNADKSLTSDVGFAWKLWKFLREFLMQNGLLLG